MAKGCLYSETEEDPEAVIEGSPYPESVHQDSGQEPWDQSLQDAPQVQTRGQGREKGETPKEGTSES